MSTQKIAFITGITGQDGSYLTELLLSKGYQVHGLIRRSSTPNTDRIDHIETENMPKEDKNLFLHQGDLSDSASIDKIIRQVQPDEVYNLGAQSHVQISFDTPVYTANVTALGVLRLLESIKNHCPKAKFYQASSSEMFGKVVESPQKETTPFYPRSPYGCAKLFGYWISRNYRESYNLFTSNGILFNHESPRRGQNFVTRKITLAVAKIILGKQDKLSLGNLDAKRDWGFAGDYVEAMWSMLQQEKPDDFVIATGETHTVREFVDLAFQACGRKISWQGQGIAEKGIDPDTKKVLVDVDPAFFRPAEVELLLGDYSKAKKELGWHPKTTFPKLVKMMIESDLENEKKHSDFKHY